MERSAAARPLTWLLALVFVAVLDAGLTRTQVLWGPRTFEESSDVRRATFAQTYQAARAVYHADEAAAGDVLLLGNSRIWLAARPSFLQPALAAAGSDARVRNLGIFGAGVGDLEMLGRHLVRRPGRLVVVTIAPDDLVGGPMSPLAGIPTDLLRYGWAPPAVGTETTVARLDRWARTLWPLYRFREFTRAALVDRARPDPAHRPFPAHFASTLDVFRLMYGTDAERVDAAFAAWRRRDTLPAFVAYLRATGGSNLDMAARRATMPARLGPRDPGPRALRALLRGLTARPWRVMLLVMPEHPMLDQDREGRWHDAARSARAFDVVGRLAAEAGVPVVDARRWMPPDAFIDFDHLFPELGGFHVRFAEEVARALGA